MRGTCHGKHQKLRPHNRLRPHDGLKPCYWPELNGQELKPRIGQELNGSGQELKPCNRESTRIRNRERIPTRDGGMSNRDNRPGNKEVCMKWRVGMRLVFPFRPTQRLAYDRSLRVKNVSGYVHPIPSVGCGIHSNVFCYPKSDVLGFLNKSDPVRCEPFEFSASMLGIARRVSGRWVLYISH